MEYTMIKYLSENCPEIRDPKRYPTKRVEEAKGTFHWLLQTRSHCKYKGIRHFSTLHQQIIHLLFTDLSDNVGVVDLFAVVPSVQTPFLLQAGEVDVPSRNISFS